MPVSVPPQDKRFRRSQVSPTRRASWRRRWLKVLVSASTIALVAFSASGAVGLALSAQSLTIRRIAVSGNVRMSQAEVRAILNDLVGTNMLRADIQASRKKLLASHWVADVEIRRVFPASVHVIVVERRAVALARLGDGLSLIDHTGTIIDDFGPAYAEFDLPIVEGLTQGGRMLIDEHRAQLATRVLASLQPRADLAAAISQVDVSDVRNVVLTLKDDTALVRVGNDRFVERLQSYMELKDTLKERVPDIDYVDLRFEQRVYVRPTHVERTPQKSRGAKG